jgi:hypothetical protein
MLWLQIQAGKFAEAALAAQLSGGGNALFQPPATSTTPLAMNLPMAAGLQGMGPAVAALPFLGGNLGSYIPTSAAPSDQAGQPQFMTPAIMAALQQLPVAVPQFNPMTGTWMM